MSLFELFEVNTCLSCRRNKKE